MEIFDHFFFFSLTQNRRNFVILDFQQVFSCVRVLYTQAMGRLVHQVALVSLPYHE